MKSNITLIGFMGSGKSTVGKYLAEELEMNFLDMDLIIQQDLNMSIQDIFLQKGESYFRSKEHALSNKMSNLTNTIIATGGGIVLNKNNLDNFTHNSHIIFLKCTFDEIIRRIKPENYRPLFSQNNLGEFKEIFHSRELLYKKYANFTVIVNNKTTEVIITEILQKIKIKN